MERLAQRQHIGFAGVVDRHARPRHERGERGNIENAAAVAREAVDEAQRKIGERAHVELDHGELRRPIEPCRLPEQPVSRVVHDDGGLDAARGELLIDAITGAALHQIDRQDMRPRPAGRGNSVRDLGKLCRATRHQHDFVPMLGEFACQRGADPGGSAGDQGDGFEI